MTFIPSPNQFAQKPVKGQSDLLVQQNTISVQIDVSSAGGLVAGQAVKLVDAFGGVPKVVEVTADTDEVFGFILFDIKSQAFNALDKAEIAFLQGGVVYMEASGAIGAGAAVMVVPAGQKVAVATTGKKICGHAIDKAADGDLIRVVVQTLPCAVQA